MANLTEAATWTAGVYQLERGDKVDAGVAGAGIANKQAKDLANRTLFLYSKIKFNQDFPGPLIVGSGLSTNMDGSAYSFAFPLASPFYTTPNDGVTRTFKITITGFANFTYNASGNVQLVGYTFNAGPSYQALITSNLRQPFQNINYCKIITLLPNTPIKVLAVNNATGANATFNDMSLTIEEQ